MGSNRFRLQVILRSVLIGLSAFLFFFMLNSNYIITSFFILLLFGLQIFLLIRFVDKTNHDLSRFLSSIEFADYSQNFNEKNFGTSFKELHTSFNNIIKQFHKTRSEMEEHFQYLQTVVKHVRTGLIGYDTNGDIELINDSAKELLGIDTILNIRQMNNVSDGLVNTLSSIKAGSKSLVKINIKNNTHQLSVSAAEFRMRSKNYTLVSLQDITGELENERMSNEMDIARLVQKRLLPVKFPEIHGYSLFAECIPAFEVGGDYFDFVHLNEHKIGIVIADVSGKGLPAAFYMTLVKGIFQSYAETSFSPKDVLIKLNSLIYKTIEKRSFITMTYAVLDYTTNKLVLARAGHEPAVYFNSSDKVNLFKPKGIGLGLESGDIFAQSIIEQEISLLPGDSLLLYTDGLTDQRDKNNADLGIERFIEIIKKYKNGSPADFSKSLLNEIKLFKSHSPQYDDITFVQLTRNTPD